MEYLIIEDYVLALVGWFIRWLLHLQTTKDKLKKKKQSFSLKFYFKDNLVLLLASGMATLGLLLSVPELLDSLGYTKAWSSLVAMGCGMSNLELVKIIQNRIVKKADELNSDSGN